MNRPIKFRAWHKTLKKMLYAPLTLSSGNLVIDKEGSLVGFIPKRRQRNDDKLYLEANLDWRGNWYENGELQDVEWMQFTGLSDKDGKEIYEGDILSWSEYQGWEDGRTFHGIYVVEWNEDKCGFVLSDPYENQDWPIDDTNFDMVIGNIYGNPNLLPKEPSGDMVELEK